jgi:hypothetical protein
MRITFSIFLLLFILSACNKDDNFPVADPCADAVVTPEVEFSDVSLQAVDNGDQHGYIIKATIRNVSDSIINGEPTFVFFVDGVPNSVTGSAICGTIHPNSECIYDKYFYRSPDENIDMSVTLDCYYYELE